MAYRVDETRKREDKTAYRVRETLKREDETAYQVGEIRKRVDEMAYRVSYIKERTTKYTKYTFDEVVPKGWQEKKRNEKVN